jgi:hypothetical protein
MNAAPLCLRGAFAPALVDRARFWSAAGLLPFRCGVPPKGLSAFPCQHARHDVAGSSRDSNSTMDCNQLIKCVISSPAGGEADPERKAEFLRQSSISLLYSPRSGETPLDKSKSVSFEVRRIALQEHKFQIGETVYFASRPIGHMIANSTYQVVRLLPSDGSDYQYRIKNPNEAFERVARESHLEYSR